MAPLNIVHKGIPLNLISHTQLIHCNKTSLYAVLFDLHFTVSTGQVLDRAHAFKTGAASVGEAGKSEPVSKRKNPHPLPSGPPPKPPPEHLNAHCLTAAGVHKTA